MQLKLVIPAPASSTASRSKRPTYVSPASNSLTFAQAGGPSTTAAIAPTSPNCTTDSGVRTCTATVSANAGPDQSFLVKTFASADGSGVALSAATIVQTIVPGQINTVPATLNGVVASISVAASPSTLFFGEPGSAAIAVNALDPSGNTIVGPGFYGDANGNPITIALKNSDTTGSTSLSRTTVTQPGSPLVLIYNGGPVLTATISGTVAGIGPASTAEQFVCRPTPGMAALYRSGSDTTNGQGFFRYDLGVTGFNPAASSEVTEPSSVPFPGAIAVDARGMTYTATTTSNNALIAAFCPDAHGAAAPVHSFVATSSSLHVAIVGLAVDAQRNLYGVSDGDPPDGRYAQLAMYGADIGGPGYANAQGAPATPTRSVSGNATQMTAPVSLAVDAGGNAYVGDSTQIEIFGPQASGNVAPDRTISNTAAGLLYPIFSRADSAGNVYVLYSYDYRTGVAGGGFALAEYPAGSPTTPSRVISGTNTRLGMFGTVVLRGDPVGPIAVDGAGNIYVSNNGFADVNATTSQATISVFGPSANGNVAPTRTFAVTGYGADSPRAQCEQTYLGYAKGNIALTGVQVGGLAADSGGNVYVGDCTGNGVLVFDSSGHFARRINASPSGIGSVGTVAIDSANNLIVLSMASQKDDGTPVGISGIFTFPPNADSTTAPTRSLIPAAADQDPLDFALDSSANMFLLEDNGDEGHPHVSTTTAEVVEYAASANGMATPIRAFSDPAANFADIQTFISVDGSGNIYIGGLETSDILEYAASSSGNVSPMRAFSDYGPSTISSAVTVDSHGTLYAASCATDSVSVYPSGSGSGAPARAIFGWRTLMYCPESIAVDPLGNIYVANQVDGVVNVFGTSANGNVSPIQRVAFPNYFGGINDVGDGQFFTIPFAIAIGPGTVPSAPASSARSVTTFAGHAFRRPSRATRCGKLFFDRRPSRGPSGARVPSTNRNPSRCFSERRRQKK